MTRGSIHIRSSKGQGFSLLEVIIATAILASSAMVLMALIGLGTKYGNRAEERTIALAQAESLLDEYLAREPLDNASNPRGDDLWEGELPGPPVVRFRLETTPYESAETELPRSSVDSKIQGPTSSPNRTQLVRVKIELFGSGPSPRGSETPLLTLTRFARRSPPQPVSESTGVAP